MSVSQRRDYFMSILMFNSLHGLAPDYMCDEINMQCDIAERSTRSLNFNNTVICTICFIGKFPKLFCV